MPIPLPVIAGVFRVALEWRHSNGQTAVNVMHIEEGGATLRASDVFEAMQDAFTGNMWGSVSVNATIANVAITPLDGTTGTQDFNPAGAANFTGQTSGDYAPNVAVIMKIGTGLRGRDNRGRLFLPFTGEQFITNGFLDSTVATGMGAAWLAAQTALVADTPTFAIGVAAYDRKHSGAGAHFNVATSLSVEPVLATQRRRQTRLR